MPRLWGAHGQVCRTPGPSRSVRKRLPRLFPRELCDPNEFEALVQQAVGANAGMSWGQLAEMLRVVVGAARKQLATVEAAAAAGTAEEAGTAEGAGQRTGAGCRAEGGVGPGLGGQCGDSDSVCGRAETAAEAEAVGGTESLPAVCGGGQGRQRGVTCPRVVHQLLVLHRAGGLVCAGRAVRGCVGVMWLKLELQLRC